MTTPLHSEAGPGGSRIYRHPVTGETAPSVTSILRPTSGDAGALLYWAAQKTAEAAIDLAASVAALPREDAVKMLAGQHKKASGASARRGDAVHSYLEAVGKAAPTPAIDVDTRPWVDTLERFLDDHQPTFLLSEQTVWGEGFAGSFDALVHLPAFGTETVLLDLKTKNHSSRGLPKPFQKEALQLTAYSRATEILGRSSTLSMPPVDRAVILAVSEEAYKVTEVSIGEREWEAFQAAQLIHAWWTADCHTLGVVPSPAELELEVWS